MKRILAALLLIFTVTTAAACGAAAPAKETASAGADRSEGSADGADTAKADAETAGAQVTEAPETEPDDENTIINDQSCLVRLSGLSDDSLWGLTVDLYCENKTELTPLNVAVEGASVNGVEADAVFSCEIAPGKSKTDSVTLTLPEDLSSDGNYTDVELLIRVYDASGASVDALSEKEFHVYPAGAEAAGKYVRDSRPDDIKIIDSDDLEVTVVGFGRDSLYECMVNLFIVNKSGRDLDISASDVRLNGKECDPMFSVTVRAGKSAFRSIGWLHSTLWEKYLWDVSDVSLTMTASEAGSPENVVASESAKFNTPAGLGAD